MLYHHEKKATMYQQPPQQGYYQPQPDNTRGFAVAALCFLLLGFGLHFIAVLVTFFPLVGGVFGIFFGFIGLASDVLGLIFLVIVVAKS